MGRRSMGKSKMSAAVETAKKGTTLVSPQSFHHLRRITILTPVPADLSSSLFKQIANPDDGVVQVNWHFQSKGWSP